MHYIRLVRPAEVDNSDPEAPVLSLKLTITTDLGDTFLSTDEPTELCFVPHSTETLKALPMLAPVNGVNGLAHWKAGMRVLKVDLPLTKHLVRSCVAIRIDCRCCGNRSVSADTMQSLLPCRTHEYGVASGLVAPLEIELADGVGSDVAVRSFQSDGTGRPLKIEEGIGESIARHIWDAGLVTTALLADSCRRRNGGFQIQDFMPIKKDTVNILELGCGVGILGIGIAMILHSAAEAQGVELQEATVLLTDLPEAEERARANIERDRKSRLPDEFPADLLYENLDWEDGSNGKFGPLVSSRFWDYIVLSDCTYNVDSFPVLLGTLSSLHSHNIKHAPVDQESNTVTRVMLSTKLRHDSEKTLFGLLEEAKWSHREIQSIPLFNLGGEEELVVVHLLENVESRAADTTQKRKNETEPDKPRKRVDSAKPQ